MLDNRSRGTKMASAAYHFRPAPSKSTKTVLEHDEACGDFADGPGRDRARSELEPRVSPLTSEIAIREEVARILESSMFVNSERLGQFLRFTVETTLDGNAETLKEYVIGTHVYGRKPS